MQPFIMGNGASSVLIRVLQQTEPIGYVQLQKEICYKKLANLIRRAEKSKDVCQ